MSQRSTTGGILGSWYAWCQFAAFKQAGVALMGWLADINNSRRAKRASPGTICTAQTP